MPTFFKTPAHFRAWLEKNAATETELIVGFYKRDSGRPSLTWPESVDEALCFGWIDGVRKRIDDASYQIRFTPRKSTSTWSAINIEKVRILKQQGRKTEAGCQRGFMPCISTTCRSHCLGEAFSFCVQEESASGQFHTNFRTPDDLFRDGRIGETRHQHSASRPGGAARWQHYAVCSS